MVMPMFRRLRRRYTQALGRSRQANSQSSSQGFTLTELLVVLLLSSGVIAGLMFLVIELMATNQRESSRAETQRDMQNAMDYITADLREAVYVYEARCLQGFTNPNDDTQDCPGILPHLPAALTNESVPVLAFWKQEPNPDAFRDICATDYEDMLGDPFDAEDDDPRAAYCLTGNGYSLVVYSISTRDPDGIWDGQARVTRYALSPFQEDGTATPGYGNPNNEFRDWPFVGENEANVIVGAAAGNPVTLVDFVDDGTGQRDGVFEAADDAVCPGSAQQYSLTPPANLLVGDLAAARSFYACVSVNEDSQMSEMSQNTEVLVYLRGNAFGRPGVFDNEEFLTALESRVLTRGVFGRGDAGD